MRCQPNIDSDERETAGLWGQLVLRMKWGGADQRPHQGTAKEHVSAHGIQNHPISLDRSIVLVILSY
jgi:hypothetical protein